MGSEETKDPVRKLGVRVFALTISVLTGQRITDPSFGLRAMRAEVTGAVRLEQPQYQAAELLIGVITHGYRVAERPATIHKRKVGQSKKGHNALYGLAFRGRDRRHLVARASAPRAQVSGRRAAEAGVLRGSSRSPARSRWPVADPADEAIAYGAGLDRRAGRGRRCRLGDVADL